MPYGKWKISTIVGDNLESERYLLPEKCFLNSRHFRKNELVRHPQNVKVNVNDIQNEGKNTKKILRIGSTK